MNKYADYLILGGGCAGVKAAEAIRSLDRKGSVVLLSSVDIGCRRPLLSKSPIGRVRTDAYLMHPQSWYGENEIELVQGKVLSMDTEKRSVETSSGEFFYGKCIYALGGYNFVPPFSGAQLEGVMTVRTVGELRDLKRKIASDGRVVVIGGGVIGIEVASELKKYGADVTILEAMPRLMPRQLDPETSLLLLEKMKDDFHIFTGVTIKEIAGSSKVEGVRLEDGRFFPCGTVFVSCGQKANIGPAKEAGIACGRSVIVNERMETSAEGVYACGDCAEFNGVNVALWSQAMAEAEVAGRNAAGGKAVLGAFDKCLLMSLGTLNIFAFGDPGLNPEKKYTSIAEEKHYGGFSINERSTQAIERRFYCDGRFTGGTILGSLRNMQAMRMELENSQQ